MERGEINFFSENDFILRDQLSYRQWIYKVIESEDKIAGDLSFIFCDDEYLHNMNISYLDHDTYTDIITFDYGIGNTLQGDIYISTERVKENANTFNVNFKTELLRVMVHGVLHLCGYKDKNERDQDLMRRKEEEKMKLFHVEQ